MRTAWLLASLAWASALAHARDLDSFHGTWRVLYKTEKGKERQAELGIGPAGAAWKTFGTSNKDVCIGREFPGTANAASPDELLIRVNRSEAIPGCSNISLTLKRRNATSLEGTFGDGRTASLEKQ